MPIVWHADQSLPGKENTVISTRFAIAILALLATAAIGSAQPVLQAVLNGASYSGNIAPGTWVSMFGTQLATSTATASTVPLQKTLGGVTVTFNGIAAPLLYVSPTQINAIVPFEITVLLSSTPQVVQVPVVVTTSAGASTPHTVSLSRNSPGLFTINGAGTGTAIAFDSQFKLTSSGETGPLVLYATGLGPTNPPASSDSGGASSEPFNRVVDDVSVFIGDVQAKVLFAGLAPGFPGIYQLNVVPNGPLTDRVYLQVNGWQSNIAKLSITPGANAANVTGKIKGLYPPTSAPVGFSAMLEVGRFNVDFDIVPGAQPFSIVAATDAGNVVYQINPPAGTYQFSMLVPTAAARSGAFSNSEFNVVWDFSTCSPNGACNPVPGNWIPASKFDPLAVEAQVWLAFPNVSSNALGPNLEDSGAGTLPPDGHISIPGTPQLAAFNFGSFMQIPEVGPATRMATFSLYVDGKLIDSQVVNYSVLQP